jgi:DNA-binding CsgD family transcriptional regulator
LAPASAAKPAAGDEPALTPREREILHLIALGWSTAHIAAHLCLTRQTVRNYASSVYAKLGVADRAEAIVWARDYQPLAGIVEVRTVAATQKETLTARAEAAALADSLGGGVGA